MKPIELFRLYAKKGSNPERYTVDEIKEMVNSGLFYLVQPCSDKKFTEIKENMTDDVLRILELHLNGDALKNIRIVLEPSKSIIKLNDETDTLNLFDVIWLAKIDTPEIKKKLLDWLRAKYGLDITENAKLEIDEYTQPAHIYVRDGNGKHVYEIRPDDGKIIETRHIEINGVEFRVEAPYKKMNTAISLSKNIIKTITNNISKLNSIGDNSIMYNESEEYGDYIILDGTMTIKQFNVIYQIIYSIPQKQGSIILIVPPSPIKGTGDLEHLRAKVNEAASVIDKIEIIDTSDMEPEEVVEKIEESLNKGRLPVLNDVPLEAYFIAIARGGKAAEYMRKHYRREVHEKILEAMEEPEEAEMMKSRLEQIVDSLGEEAEKELRDILNTPLESEIISVGI